ncbi:hypothetical protein [Candidatus Cyanaurora vandensis]|uniref:hypothetical protein n=1 Tax=Candidatus Cyanaurora vandensis TaxID=2714958 RepID=UPI00257A3823|nr:hypothetical protein [Candidatus Cyanaurora vandensis]
MGDSRRRKQLDPTYGQTTQEDADILDFFGQAWCRRHSRCQRRQAYLEMQVFLQTLTPDEIQEVTAQWQGTSPRRPFATVLFDYVEHCEHNPLLLVETDASSRLIDVFPLEVESLR